MGDPFASSGISRACASTNSSCSERRVPMFKFSDVTCGICLDNVKNRAFVNSCSHGFCLGCLLKWAKQKLECPLCKRTFSSVYHSVRSPDVYKRLPLRFLTEPPDFRCWGEFGYYNSQFGRIRKICDCAVLLTTDEFELPINVNLCMRRNGYSFRQLVYENNYWSLGERAPRDWLGPEFYTENPDYLVHLFPWLYRELEVLLSNKDHLIDEAFDLVVSILQIYEVYNRKCVNILKPFLGDQTHHFLHELINFIGLRMPMPVYDRTSRYCTVNVLRDNDIRDSIVIGPGENEYITLDEGSNPKITTKPITRRKHDILFPTVSYDDIVAITPGSYERYRWYAVGGGILKFEIVIQPKPKACSETYDHWFPVNNKRQKR